MLEVGSRVVISAMGRSRWLDDDMNPYRVEGTIRSIGHGDRLCVSVNWDNGCTNSYHREDLEAPSSEFALFHATLADQIMRGLGKKGTVKTAFNTPILEALEGLGVIHEVRGKFFPVEMQEFGYLTMRHFGELVTVKEFSRRSFWGLADMGDI